MEQSRSSPQVISRWWPAAWILLHGADVVSTLFALNGGCTQEVNPVAAAIGLWPFFIVKVLAACFVVPVFYQVGWQKWFPFMNGVMIGVIALNVYWGIVV